MTSVIQDPCDMSYFLTCDVVLKTITVKEHNKEYENRIALLIPRESDQRTSFLRAWLPDTLDEHFELNVFLKPPVDSPCRVSIHRGPGKFAEKHYLFVMSKGVEEVLRRFDIKKVDIKILPESDVTASDFARDSDEGNYDLEQV